VAKLSYADKLDLVLEWPLDALRINQLKSAPTETLAAKFAHFQQKIAELTADGSTLPVLLTPRVAVTEIKGWDRIGHTGIPLKQASVRDTLRYAGEILGLEFRFTTDGVMVDFKSKK
jgi:hypothetical protein